MANETKWMNEFPIKYKELFENYKNIEMFQNIYNTSEKNSEKKTNIEGFDIFDKFDMHQARDHLKESPIGKIYNDTIKQILDYIFCPFYKSDELIDTGIQTLLNIFLQAECGNKININYENTQTSNTETSNTETVDLTELIDPDLLYFEKFQNKEGLSNLNVDCKEKNNKISSSISKIIREQIYHIIFLPLIFHIFYNFYYMFCYKNSFGEKPVFVDIETDYYNPYIYPNLNYFVGISVKPLFWLYWALNTISNWELLRYFTDKYPYLFYLIIFAAFYGGLSVMGKNIVHFLYDLVCLKINLFTNVLITYIIGFEFVKALISESIDIRIGWPVSIMLNPFSGIIKWIIYWIIRLVIVIILNKTGLPSYLCNLYSVVYMLFGIFISQDKDVFEVYKDIDNSVYVKIYQIFNKVCDSWNTFYFFLHIFTKYSITFLVELTIFYILYKGFLSYSNVDNVNIKSFLYILNFTAIFLLGIWSFLKYNKDIKKMDEKYDYVVKELARKIKKKDGGNDTSSESTLKSDDSKIEVTTNKLDPKQENYVQEDKEQEKEDEKQEEDKEEENDEEGNDEEGNHEEGNDEEKKT
jgi:hypothetical protein